MTAETWVLVVWFVSSSSKVPATIGGYTKLGCEQAKQVFLQQTEFGKAACIPGPEIRPFTPSGSRRARPAETT